MPAMPETLLHRGKIQEDGCSNNDNSFGQNHRTNVLCKKMHYHDTKLLVCPNILSFLINVLVKALKKLEGTMLEWTVCFG
jgi:hypothetical protein